MTNETLGSLLDRKGRLLFAIEPDQSVYDAIAMMSERSVGALLVMMGEQLLGIISERDYTRKVILMGRSSKDTPVSEIMTRDLVTGNSQMCVPEAMALMSQHRVRHLPVMHSNRVVGVVSMGDLVKTVISAQEEHISHLHNYIAGGYM